LQKVLESDWTLDAIKRREEERLKGERTARQADAKTVETHHAADMSGNNWVAEAFRRRQEEERAKAAIDQSSGGDRTDVASREVPVDNWLIEGFKRHQEEERRLELIARSEEAGALTVSAARSSFDAKSLPSSAHAALDETANRGPRAGDEVARRGGVARKIAIAGVVVVGLVSVIGLKTALWNSVDAPRGFDRRAPSATPPVKARPAQKEQPRPIQGASQGADTANVPATRPAANGGPPASDSTDHPGVSAPAKPSDAAIISAPPAEAPQNSTRPQPENKAQSPTAEPSDKPPQAIAAPPAASAPAPGPAGPNDPASPARPDSTAKPASVGPETSGGATGQDQNAAEPNRHAPNSNVDAKSKQQARGKSGARHSSGKSEGLSTFLKRTANSVRKFFGRLGTQ